MAKKKSIGKGMHPATVLLAVLFLLAGCAAGVFASVQITKGDEFRLNGEKYLTLSVGAEYREEGATVISFGRDISDRVTVGGDALDTSVPGKYQLVYTVDDFRWGEYQLVRTVVVEGGEDGQNGR